MNTFLRKIATIPTIQNVLLLSHQGEILFVESNQSAFKADQQFSVFLHGLVSELHSPQTATFYYDNGLLYLHWTSIGYIVITMDSETKLQMLKGACQNGANKLGQKGIAKKILISMLEKADDRVKPLFIRALVPIADKDVALALLKLLANTQKLTTEVREDILLLTYQTLGHCQYFEATHHLQNILSEHDSGTNVLDAISLEAVQLAIRQLESTPQEIKAAPPLAEPGPASEGKKSTIKNTAAAPVVHVTPALIETLPEKSKIEALVADNKKPEALQRILSLIESATQNRKFDKAEALQEWLLQIEPMALAESIRATELIEESKVALIDHDFYQLWQGVVEILTTEEFIALYHAMDCRNYANGEHLVKQGQITPELYFVNTGRVQLYTHIDGREIPLQLVQEGGLVGHGTFFQLSVWTSGAKSQGAQVYALSYDGLQELEKKYPGIESKLSDYCSHIDTSSAFLKKMRRSRRQLERKNIIGKVTFELLRKDGAKTGIEGRGNLLDISQGGIGFTVHSSKRKNTHQLFGKLIALKIKRSNSKPHLERRGKILAVRDHDIIGNAYSVHVQFDTILSGSEMREIVAFSR